MAVMAEESQPYISILMGKSSVNLWGSWDCYDPIDTLQCWCFIVPVRVPRLSTPCEAAALQQRVEKIQEAFESGSGRFFENLEVLTWKKWVTWIGKLSRNVGKMSRILDDHQFPEMAMRYAAYRHVRVKLTKIFFEMDWIHQPELL